MSIQSEINRLKNNVAATYAAMEEQGATMPTQQNSANLAATARTIPTGSGGGGTTVQADLSVNNPNDPSYVKERTHWKEEVGVDGKIIPKTTLRFGGSFRLLELSGVSGGVQNGGKYIVTHNDTDYECVGKAYENGVYIGNGSFLGSSNLENTGEPFCITGSGGPYYYLYKADKTAETVTVMVVGKKETVWHKLDSRFLNEALQFSSEMVEVLPETTLELDPESGGFEDSVALSLVAGTTYKVKWNGVDYDCTCTMEEVDDSGDGTLVAYYLLGNVGAFTGTGDTGEPFTVLSVPSAPVYGIVALDGSTSVTLSITGEVITKLDSKYLNEALQFGAETKVILPETTIEVVAEMEGAPISAALSVEVGKTYAVMWNGTKYVCTAQATPSGGGVSGAILGNFGTITGGASTGEPFVIVCLDADSAAAMGVGGLAGPLDGSESITLSIILDNITKLDSKYLDEALQFGETMAEIFPETTFEQGEILATVPLIEGGIYKVKYNGVEYSCTCRSYTGDGLTIYVLGNYDAWSGEGDTGEPFVFMSAPSLGACMVDVFDEPTSVTLSISGAVIKKLDNKYLDIEWTPSKKPATRVEVFPETTVESTGSLVPLTEEFMASAEDKAPYIVTWNGTEYICNAMLLSTQFVIGNLYMINPNLAPNTGEPFLFFTTGENMIISYMGEGSATFKIDRGYYDTLPYEFAPANYTIPYDLEANNAQVHNDVMGMAMTQAEYALKHGGKVFGTVDGEPVEFLAIRADNVDGMHTLAWRVMEPGVRYGDIYQQVNTNSYKAQTPAIDRKDILLRYDNSSDRGNVPPEKFKFTVDKNGNLMSANADGTNQKAYLNTTPVTSADNGKFLRVVDGAWAAVALTDVSEVGA